MDRVTVHIRQNQGQDLPSARQFVSVRWQSLNLILNWTIRTSYLGGWETLKKFQHSLQIINQLLILPKQRKNAKDIIYIAFMTNFKQKMDQYKAPEIKVRTMFFRS